MAYHDSNPLLLETLSTIGGVTASYHHLYTVLLHLLGREDSRRRREEDRKREQAIREGGRGWGERGEK